MSRNLAKCIGNELIRQLEIELASTRNKIEKLRVLQAENKDAVGPSTSSLTSIISSNQLMTLTDAIKNAKEQVAHLQAENLELHFARYKNKSKNEALDEVIRQYMDLNADLNTQLEEANKMDTTESNSIELLQHIAAENKVLRKEINELRKALQERSGSAGNDLIPFQLDALELQVNAFKQQLLESNKPEDAFVLADKIQEIEEAINRIKNNLN